MDAEHWSEIGEVTDADVVILRTARQRDAVVVTGDLGFGSMLASSGASGPSVVQLRGGDLRPEAVAPMLIATVAQLTSELESGALITLEPGRQRVRVLPFIGE